MKLLNNETKLIGHWEYNDGTMKKDEITARIEALIQNDLLKVATDSTGWDILYIDQLDKRYWELTYTESELQGGGPPTLSLISIEEAKLKYRIQ